MTPIPCRVEQAVLIDTETGLPVPGLRATCSRCGHVAESFGRRGRSTRKCLTLLRDQCPNKEYNIYEHGNREDATRGGVDADG